jgi:hypothetical protein
MKRKLIAAAVTVMSLSAHAGIVNVGYGDFSDTSEFQINGDAATHTPNSDNVLRLTDGRSQSGSAFLTNPISLLNEASFSSFFSFQISNPSGSGDEDGIGADGLVFALQTISNTAGSFGGGLGYSGIDRSLGVEFDTYNNGAGDGSNGNHVGINLNGSVSSVLIHNEPVRFNDGDIWNVWVDYDGDSNTLGVSYSMDNVRPDAFTLSYEVDLVSIFGSDDVFVGFSSGTGGGGGTHDILSFGFNNDFRPIEDTNVTASVSEPSAIFLMGMGLLALGGVGRRKS